MNNIPTAEEFCKALDPIHGESQDVVQSHIEFARLHVEALLEEITKGENIEIGCGCGDVNNIINYIKEQYLSKSIK
jgi:hypothetical protein